MPQPRNLPSPYPYAPHPAIGAGRIVKGNGKREIARRVRQIEFGGFNIENGLRFPLHMASWTHKEVGEASVLARCRQSPWVRL